MKEPDFIIEIFLKPGEWHWGDTDTRIRTILGSCVALTFWHPKLKIGGMCHYLLPTRKTKTPEDPADGRYGDEALAVLVKEIEKSKTKISDYDIKLFGGANMFSDITRENSINVGEKNIRLAEEFIKEHGLKLAAKDVAGVEHRSILLDLWSGDVWLKKPKKEK